MKAILRRFWALSILVALTACAVTPAPQTAALPGEPADPAPSARDHEPGDPMSRTLAAVLERGGWRDLRIEAECQDDTAQLRTITLFGSGVGIWQRERQFPVAREPLVGLLLELDRIGFGALPESFGGPNDPDDTPPEAFGLRLICRVRVVLDGVDKQSYQLSEGRQSAVLKAMAEKILAMGEGPGPSGIAAASLSDGLEKLARGELAPETLTLQLQRQPEDLKSTEGGWILRLEHGAARLTLSSPDTGWSEPRQVALAPEEIDSLAGRLAEAHPEDLPVNLYSAWYQDLEIRVLNRKVTLQARRFAGLTPETHGEKQERFDAMIEAIEAVKNRVAEER
jgi:hypothetical protein